MSKLLLDESPILVLPSLAEKVGLNEAIFLQQLNYWLKDSNNIRDGHTWVYNTYEDWQEQFPFWSVSTIRRVITKLENADLLIIGNFNKLKIDKTKWYRINYEAFKGVNSPSVQSEQSECSEWTVEQVNLNRPLPEITTEITSKKKEEEEAPATGGNPFRFFEENGFGTIGGYIAQKIGKWCDDLSDELVLESMKIAVERGAKSWSYVEKILINWADKKIKTVDQANALILAYKEKQSKQGKVRKGYATRTEKLPGWFNEQEDKQQPINPKANTTGVEQKRAELNETLRKLRERSSNDGDPLRQGND
ncbi:DnaD domain protein [Cytobacillus praedii]|uniref:DnaD domain-containing protein n=1 Tax=Cytobacillus praedii TaxID=1742358 RepID=UPI002E1C0B3F|nr:DnaD domain protein [Cytobacillus praedii]MED3549987.1 DnaD domain protein [Cytobacillus praedii]